jgi:hypothetical protein
MMTIFFRMAARDNGGQCRKVGSVFAALDDRLRAMTRPRLRTARVFSILVSERSGTAIALPQRVFT